MFSHVRLISGWLLRIVLFIVPTLTSADWVAQWTLNRTLDLEGQWFFVTEGATDGIVGNDFLPADFQLITKFSETLYICKLTRGGVGRKHRITSTSMTDINDGKSLNTGARPRGYYVRSIDVIQASIHSHDVTSTGISTRLCIHSYAESTSALVVDCDVTSHVFSTSRNNSFVFGSIALRDLE